MGFKEAMASAVNDENERLLKQIEGLGVKLPQSPERRAAFSRYVIGLKKPGLKKLLGENPLNEFGEDADEFLRIKKERF